MPAAVFELTVTCDISPIQGCEQSQMVMLPLTVPVSVMRIWDSTIQNTGKMKGTPATVPRNVCTMSVGMDSNWIFMVNTTTLLVYIHIYQWFCDYDKKIVNNRQFINT